MAGGAERNGDDDAGESVALALLSPRERWVAVCVANGDALKVIAGSRSLSIQSVSTYLSRAKKKLHASSRAQLIIALDITPGAREPERGGQADGGGSEARRARRAGLSPGETRVFLWISGGLRNVDVAAVLGISQRTVAAHASAIMRKFGVFSRAELLAATVGARRGDVEADPVRATPDVLVGKVTIEE